MSRQLGCTFVARLLLFTLQLAVPAHARVHRGAQASPAEPSPQFPSLFSYDCTLVTFNTSAFGDAVFTGKQAPSLTLLRSNTVPRIAVREACSTHVNCVCALNILFSVCTTISGQHHMDVDNNRGRVDWKINFAGHDTSMFFSLVFLDGDMYTLTQAQGSTKAECKVQKWNQPVYRHDWTKAASYQGVQVLDSKLVHVWDNVLPFFAQGTETVRHLLSPACVAHKHISSNDGLSPSALRERHRRRHLLRNLLTELCAVGGLQC